MKQQSTRGKPRRVAFVALVFLLGYMASFLTDFTYCAFHKADMANFWCLGGTLKIDTRIMTNTEIVVKGAELSSLRGSLGDPSLKETKSSHDDGEEEDPEQTTQEENTAQEEETGQRTMFVYMTAKTQENVVRQVSELKEEFGENLLVAWGNKNKPCPYANCLESWPISESHKLSHRCCGQEYAITWAMDNRENFDYVWFMEDDVHYTDFELLRKVVNDEANGNADTVSHQGKATVGGWFYKNETIRDMKKWLDLEAHPELHKHSMMNMFRLSRNFLDKLDETYNKLDKEWTFFESFFPTVSTFYNLTWHKFDNAKGAMGGARPCKTEFSEPGLYHPVKFHQGKPYACECFEFSYRKACERSPKGNCDMCKEVYWDKGIFKLDQSEAKTRQSLQA